MRSFTVHCGMLNAISDLHQPDARSNMSPACNYQNWLQIRPNVFLGSKIKNLKRSTIFKTFLLLVSLSLHAIDVLPRETRCQLPSTRCTEQAVTCLSAAIYMQPWSWVTNPSWVEGTGSFLRSSRSIYQYHNKRLSIFRLLFTPQKPSSTQSLSEVTFF